MSWENAKELAIVEKTIRKVNQRLLSLQLKREELISNILVDEIVQQVQTLGNNQAIIIPTRMRPSMPADTVVQYIEFDLPIQGDCDGEHWTYTHMYHDKSIVEKRYLPTQYRKYDVMIRFSQENGYYPICTRADTAFATTQTEGYIVRRTV